jgi:transcriptional antiterminator Rof (Rho-off)
MTRKPDPHEEWRMIRTNAKRSSAPKSSQSSASSEAHSRKEPVKVPMAATLLPHLPQPPPSASITLNTLPTLAATINAASNAKRISQEEKRKMLWGQPEKASSAKVWEKMKFSNDDQTEKFRKLMGIKSGSASSASSSDTQAKKPEEEVQLQQKQETIFRDLNKQYEVARMSTHTHRGIGLGFGSSGLKD